MKIIYENGEREYRLDDAPDTLESLKVIVGSPNLKRMQLNSEFSLVFPADGMVMHRKFNEEATLLAGEIVTGHAVVIHRYEWMGNEK